MKKQYNVVNGTAYHIDTENVIIKLLERIRQDRQRVRFHWGNTKTGEDWNDTYDVTGKIGRSTGSFKIPILLKLRTSHGGGGILDHCIVKITETVKPHRVIYQHPKYYKGFVSRS